MQAETQLGQYIPLHYHYQMLLDEARMVGFRRAIEEVVPAGGRVLELGGGTGVLSHFAASRAEKVWCVERQPALAERARELLRLNGSADKVEVVTADVTEFLPPEPVDVVICEMLHSALLREKQIEIIDDFRTRYRARFGGSPRFIPEATILAVEPVHVNFDFFGYRALVPVFEDPGNPMREEQILSMGDALSYAIIDYERNRPERFQFNRGLRIGAAGRCNALRFITKNMLAILPDRNQTITWMNQNLILPLDREFELVAGDRLRIGFEYAPGAEISDLSVSLQAAVAHHAPVA